MIKLMELTRVGEHRKLQGRTDRSKGRSKLLPRFPDGSLYYRYYRNPPNKSVGLVMTTDGEWIYIDLVDVPRRWRYKPIPGGKVNEAIDFADSIIWWWESHYKTPASKVADEFGFKQLTSQDDEVMSMTGFIPEIKPVSRQKSQVVTTTRGSTKDAQPVATVATGAVSNAYLDLDDLKYLTPSKEPGYRPEDLPEGKYYLEYDDGQREVSVNNLERKPELVITGNGPHSGYWDKGDYDRLTTAVADGELAARFFANGKSVTDVIAFFEAKYGDAVDNRDDGDW